MQKFAIFFAYSSGSWARLIIRPDDRIASLRRLFESVGGTLESAYWMPLGTPHDGIIIADAPDTITAAALTVAVTSTGALHNVQTYELLTQEKLGEMLLLAKDALQVYEPPGQAE
jgi:uncharacterized protein with GYD domain